jgi:hypothetical protein
MKPENTNPQVERMYLERKPAVISDLRPFLMFSRLPKKQERNRVLNCRSAFRLLQWFSQQLAE